MAIGKPRRARANTRRGAAGTPVPNPDRGEHQLVLAGKPYLLRPSFGASRAIEDQLGLTLVELARAGNAMALSLDQLGVIAAEMIRAGAAKGDVFTSGVSAERIAELIFEEGQGMVTAVITFALLDAVNGGRTKTGEPRAVAEKTTSATATAA